MQPRANGSAHAIRSTRPTSDRKQGRMAQALQSQVFLALRAIMGLPYCMRTGWAEVALRLGLVLSTLAVAACAGAPRESASLGAQTSALQGGAVDFSDRAAVGVLVHHPGGRSLCSGALISANVAIVARHCLSEVEVDRTTCGQELGPAVSPLAVEVTTAVTSDRSLPDDGGAVHAVNQIGFVPGGSDACGFDVAFVTLTTPCGPAEATPLVPRETPAQPSESYSALGYGMTCDDAGLERCYLESGTRRRADGLKVACTTDCPRDRVATSEWQGDRGACLGDSGGPALDANGRLIGIAVRGTNDATGNCIEPIYAGMDTWMHTLKQAVRSSADAAGLAVPSWARLGDADVDTGDAPPGEDAGPSRPLSDAGPTLSDATFYKDTGSTTIPYDAADRGANGSAPSAGGAIETADGAALGDGGSSLGTTPEETPVHEGCSCAIEPRKSPYRAGPSSLLLVGLGLSPVRRLRPRRRRTFPLGVRS